MPPEVDELPKIYPGTGYYHRFRRWFRSNCVVSPKNPRTMKFLRSRAAVNAERYQHMRSHPYMIHPFSNLRSGWEIYMFVVFTSSLIMVPLITSFTLEELKTEWVVFSLILDLLCLGDIVMTFFTGDFDTSLQEVQLDPKIVARKYVRGFFFVDLLSSLPLDYITGLSDIASRDIVLYYIGLFRLLKIFRVKSLVLYFNRIVLVYSVGDIKAKLVKMGLLVFLYLHWVAGLEFQIPLMVEGSKSDTDIYRSWIYKGNLLNATIGEKYVKSMFRAISVTMHVSYGHHTPVTDEDMIVFVVLSLAGEVLFVLVVALAMQIFYILNTSVAKFEEISLQLREYMRHKQLPEQFQAKLMTFYEFRFHKSYFREKDILSSLTGQLRQDIVLHSCRHLVENVGFFQDLSPTLLVRIVSCLRSEIFLSNQVIVKYGTKGDSMYFIASGTVAVFTSTGKEVCHLEDGSHFGEIALISDEKTRVASVIAVESCELYRLDRADFMRAVSPYEDLLKKVKEIAYQRMEELHGLDGANVYFSATTINPATKTDNTDGDATSTLAPTESDTTYLDYYSASTINPATKTDNTDGDATSTLAPTESDTTYLDYYSASTINPATKTDNTDGDATSTLAPTESDTTYLDYYSASTINPATKTDNTDGDATSTLAPTESDTTSPDEHHPE